jgi:hypothetical protein
MSSCKYGKCYQGVLTDFCVQELGKDVRNQKSRPKELWVVGGSLKSTSEEDVNMTT